MATEVKNSNEYVVWGKSLPVPSVQEIVRNDIQILPERYIQEQNLRPQESEFSAVSSEIPIINFSLLASGDEAELRNLDNACKEWGFFYITNHGIAEKVIHDMKKVVGEFFELPIDDKKNYAMEAHDLQGYGQGQVISEEQKLDWCDVLFLQAIPHKNRKMKHWPIDSVPDFKEVVDEYTAETHKVAEELISKLSVLMGMDKDGLKKLHQEVKQAIRLNIYPPCTRPDLVLGISPHSDGGTVTLLMQDDHVTALQIKHKDRWVSVKPIPGSFVVNLGDVVELLSNGVYKSIEHRGVTNEKHARMSLATFVFPAEEVEIGPLESMMTADRPRVYRDIKFMDYIKYTLERNMDGKTHTDFLKLHGA